MMVTERRVVTVLALATAVLVGFLLFTGHDGSPTPGSGGPRAQPTQAPPTASASAVAIDESTSGVPPVGAGRCPRGHRVKGATSGAGDKTFYRPGSPTYGTIRAERCFADASAAEAAGFADPQIQ